MSISLIAVIMAAFSTFFVNSVAYTTLQRTTQVATQIANSQVDLIRALPASDRLIGHDLSSVTAQFLTGNVSPTVLPWLATMVPAIDLTIPAPATGTGLTAAIPTVAVPQTVNNVAYGVNVYLGTCVILTGLTLNASCALAAVTAGIKYLRAVVAVTWTGPRCPTSGCTYVTATLLSTIDDPLFTLGQSAPPLPILNSPGNQISAVGDAINLAAAFSAAPSYSFAITGNLPTGLTLNTATGLIGGTALAVQASTSVTLTLTDGYGRSATATFTWTVLAALVGTAPTAQASIIGVAIAGLTVSASGGSPAYVWSDPGGTLPPGLSLSTVNNQARITGTPTTTGMTLPLPLAGVAYPVTLTVIDSTTTRVTTVSFSWTVNYPPFAATNPGPQTSTVGAPDTLALSVTGGSGSFAWTGTLPPGLSLTPLGAISGTPTAAGVTSATLTATDTKISGSAQTFTVSWTVFAAPTVASPGSIVRDVGESVSLQLALTCPNTPCTYALNNGPAGLGVNAAGLLTGTVNTVQALNAVTVTATDSSGGTATTAAFAVTVNALPTISSPGNQTITPGSGAGLNVATLVSGGTPALTYSAAGLPTWLTLNTSTGAITGTAPTTPGTTSGIILTVTDGRSKSASTAAFSWIVVGGPAAPTGLTVANGNGTVTASWTAPTGSVTGYTVTSTPGGVFCANTTARSCTISGLTNGVHYALTVTATNTSGTSPASTAVVAIPYPAAVMSKSNGMTLWLDGADPTVLLNSSGCTGSATTTIIGCWLDKSGNVNNFSQSNTSNQPGIATWNGLTAANFADYTDVLNSISASAQYRTAFVAANVTNAVVAPYVIIDLFGNATQDFNVRVGSNVPRATPNNNDWSYNTGAPTLNWTNGSQAAYAPNPMAMITTDQAQATSQFSASVSNTFMNRGVVGQVGDVITFGKVLTTTERRAVEEYLANKWGVSITPGVPQNVAVANGDTNVTASWAAPTSSNGGAVTGYTATLSPSGASCTTAGLSCPITGLTNGVVQALTVTATNSTGIGPASAAVNAIPYPASVMSTANGMTLWLDGADPTVLLASSACAPGVATTTVGCWKDKSGQTTPNNFSQATPANQPVVTTWNGLPAANFGTSDVLNSVNSNATYQTVLVAANVTNAAGSGVIVNLLGAAGIDYGVQVGSGAGRNAPTNGQDWSAGTGTPPLNWANGAQAANPSQPLAVITSDVGANPLSGSSFGATATVSSTVNNRGLMGQVGDVITFNKALSTGDRLSVEAYLANKWGVPQAPTAITTRNATSSSVTVSWTAPSSFGGAATTGYTVTSSPDSKTCSTTTAFSCVVTGLRSNTRYTFTVAANPAGAGPGSAPSDPATTSK